MFELLKIPTIWRGKTAPRSEVFPYAMANGQDTKLPRLSLSLSRDLEAVLEIR
jgi:hypothetical protein